MMDHAINLGDFEYKEGELIYIKHCDFNLAILWITKELSLPLTIFEDIRKRKVKKIRFINTNKKGELANAIWDFTFEEIDEIKREKKMFQETQYYFSVSNKLQGGKTNMNIKDKATAYEPPTTLNIADLDECPLDLDLKEGSGTNAEGKDFTYNYAELNGKQYRVPNSVLEEIQKILKLKPEVTKVKVTKTGSGLATRYKVDVI